mmetsp:Transcript_151/g.619  ORF Transcript_151/g.619 Transcript_151/m.619 type:complete len:291 (+) Transcript_151:321-1193(+)
MDMSSANSVASTPSGHTRAASTRTGMKATCPTTASAIESATAKTSLGTPSCVLRPLTSTSCVRLSAVPTSALYKKILRNGVLCSKLLYSTTPQRLAMAVASCTRPRNSGVKPSSSVWKKNMAWEACGVACHRKRKAVGDQMSRRRTARHRLSVCSRAARAAPAGESHSPEAPSTRSSSSTSATAVTSSGSAAVTVNTKRGPYSSTRWPPYSAAMMEPTARAPQLRLCSEPSRSGSSTSRTRSTTTESTTTSAIATPTLLSTSPPITAPLPCASVASVAQPRLPATPHTAM